MSLEVFLHTVSNSIIFGVCSWAILSSRVHDGVVIKAGLIIAAFAALANMGTTTFTPSSLAMNIALAMMCAGAYLRVEIYPKYFEKVSKLCTICSNIDSLTHPARRKEDQPPPMRRATDHINVGDTNDIRTT